jgi:hypothetical protein
VVWPYQEREKYMFGEIQQREEWVINRILRISNKNCRLVQ